MVGACTESPRAYDGLGLLARLLISLLTPNKYNIRLSSNALSGIRSTQGTLNSCRVFGSQIKPAVTVVVLN